MGQKRETLLKEILKTKHPMDRISFQEGVEFADNHPSLENHKRVLAQVEVVEYPANFDINQEEYWKQAIAKNIGYKLLEDGLLNFTIDKTPDGITTYRGEVIVFNPKENDKFENR